MNTRDQFIETTCGLLETQGYHATGLNQVVQESGAPKGSLYYHFPGGKAELAAAAVARTGADVVRRVQANLAAASDPAEAVRGFVRLIADAVEASGFRAGGPLTMVAMETATTDEALNLACRAAFGQIVAAFEEKLLASGLSADRAGELALFITASIEGGILLSRTYHSGDPLRRVADELARVITSG